MCFLLIYHNLFKVVPMTALHTAQDIAHWVMVNRHYTMWATENVYGSKYNASYKTIATVELQNVQNARNLTFFYPHIIKCSV